MQREIWLSVTDAAALLGVSRAAISDAHRRGRIRARRRPAGAFPHLRPGREIPMDEVVRWCARRAATASERQEVAP